MSKIFGLGLSKTGTSSLIHALQRLGIPSCHFPSDETTRDEITAYLKAPVEKLYLTILNSAVAIADTPVCCVYPALDRTYPGSKFILTTRDLKSWLKSCRDHWERLPLSPPGQVGADGKDLFRRVIREHLYGSADFAEKLYAEAYNRYVQGVLDYFKNQPDRLLIMDIVRGDSWDLLCPFLNIPKPAFAFPHANRSPVELPSRPAADTMNLQSGPAEICFITTCMGRLDHLRETLPTLVAQPHASVVVVDYSCPERCGEWVERDYPQVRVVRVPGKSRFNLSHARNVGASAADAPWLCFIDADAALASGFTETVLPSLQAGRFYRPVTGNAELSGMMVCRQADFAKADGYDEVMQGWGAEDKDLRNRLVWLGLAPDGISENLVRAISHDDSLRTKFYDLKDRNVSGVLGELYLNVKSDLTRLLGQLPSLSVRQQIHNLVSNWVTSAYAAPGKTCELKLVFRKVPIFGKTFTPDPPGRKGRVESCLAYALTVDESGRRI
jgi:hypothetical protein